MLLKEKIYFIAAIGTDIGKTFFVEKICQILRQKKLLVSAIKPIACGFGDDDQNSDSAKILTVLGLEISKNNLDKISPWRFEQATSPHFAAKNSAKEISFEEVINFCREKISVAKKENQFLFIEAAGGVMTPINDEKNFLDLAAELRVPVLLLSANYLGAISHTLCAVEALKKHQISPEKIIINEYFLSEKKSSSVDISQVITTIQNFTKIETILLRDFLDKLS